MSGDYFPHDPPADVLPQVRAAWAGALGHDKFGDNEDFFAVGGHSLMVPRIMAKLGVLVGRRLTLRLFFDHPTVDELGSAIARISVTAGG